MNVPTDASEVGSLLKLTRYLNRILFNYASIIAPLLEVPPPKKEKTIASLYDRADAIKPLRNWNLCRLVKRK